MNNDEFDFDDSEDWEARYQISYTSGKPAPMKEKRRKSLASWQRIEKYKDQAELNKQIAQDDVAYYDL